MRKFPKLLVALVLSAFVSVSVLAEEINVLAAASLKFVLEDIKKEFLKTHKKDKIEVSYISSGKAYAQIQNGSPTHLFIAADTEYPQKLYKEKLTAEKPRNYAKGKLVLMSADKNFKVDSIEILKSDKLTDIAIPNPKVAPYGRAAEEFLKASKLQKDVKSKLRTGESIGQAYAQITEGGAQVGFNALSMVIKNDEKKKDKIKNLSYIVIDEKTYKPINQALVIPNHGKDSALAKEFAEFVLNSDFAAKTFKAYGYEKADK